MGIISIENIFESVKVPPKFCSDCRGEMMPIKPSFLEKIIEPFYYNSSKYSFMCCQDCLKEIKLPKVNPEFL